ncbi:hypothetical protein PORCRE_279 [Porphyromonas crevioricanis JCM 15906]|uniref:Uncharacterized protein n=1 Tax=Porphyromonas crevioricanis JCM 15906 TaxID=1305617 RepID=T1DQ77_9PORP|nr:hypothetical protein PORCRE_279 [Porphyromonas crevioricanis JCM 15906]GAD07250.1 hypothetical protein PORCAN_870 [Porphyromonas crevioricanis JCM 13913]
MIYEFNATKVRLFDETTAKKRKPKASFLHLERVSLYGRSKGTNK